MKNIKFNQNQSGIGMIEVIVSLLLLAIGILGFTALQARSVTSTSESLARTNALNTMSNLVEKMRYNPTEYATYETQLNFYDEEFQKSSAPTKPVDCFTEANGCTANQQADFDSYLAAESAFNNGFRMQMSVCPDTGGGILGSVMQTRCVIAAWNNTLPVYGTDTDVSDGSMSCMSSATKTYIAGSECLMMEAI